MTAQILKPFRLSPVTGEPEKQVVAVLKELLEKAERCEITGMACTIAGPDGGMLSVTALGSASGIGLLGGVRLLEHDMIKEFWPTGSKPSVPPAA